MQNGEIYTSGKVMIKNALPDGFLLSSEGHSVMLPPVVFTACKKVAEDNIGTKSIKGKDLIDPLNEIICYSGLSSAVFYGASDLCDLIMKILRGIINGKIKKEELPKIAGIGANTIKKSLLDYVPRASFLRDELSVTINEDFSWKGFGTTITRNHTDEERKDTPWMLNLGSEKLFLSDMQMLEITRKAELAETAYAIRVM